MTRRGPKKPPRGGGGGRGGRGNGPRLGGPRFGWDGNAFGGLTNWTQGQGPTGPWTVPPQNPHPNPGDDNAPEPFDQGAFDAMYALLDSYGLSSLGGFIRDLILSGTTDSASLMLALQQTNEWKQRFAGNEMLRQNGLGVLSPAEYLATERSFAQIMKNYGLPAGFYDDPADFAKWIGRNVSPAELQQRVAAYSDLANRQDPAIVAQLQSMGMSQGDLLAFTMDPDRAAPLVMRQYQTALLGGAARRSGVVADNEYLGKLAGMGITEQQAAQGYGAIGESLDTAKTLSSVYGVDYGQRDMESEVFESNAKSAKKRKRLASQERASFSGSAGQSGIQKNTAGSY